MVKLLSAAIGALMLPAAANAAVFYIGTSPTVAPAANPEIALEVGQSTSLYIWGAASKPTNPVKLTAFSLRLSETRQNGGDLTTNSVVIANPVRSTTDPDGNPIDIPRWNGVTPSADVLRNVTPTSLFGRTDALSEVTGDATAVSVTDSDGVGRTVRLLATVTVTAASAGISDLYLGMGSARIAESPEFTDTVFGFGDTGFNAKTAAIGTTSAVRDARITITPIPEPATFGLLGVGGLGLLARRRRSA